MIGTSWFHWLSVAVFRGADDLSRERPCFVALAQEAAERGLILVDTKYELGKDSQGNILLVDEIHTPDSSRYWVKVCAVRLSLLSS